MGDKTGIEWCDLLSASLTTLMRKALPDGVQALAVGDHENWMRMRAKDVTASVAAALFGDGVHPYETAYGLWAVKSRLLGPKDETPAMRRGRLLEPVHVELLREERPFWTIERGGKYYSETASRIGATPDVFALRPDRAGFGIVQLKSVGKFAFDKGWRTPEGDVDIPLWVAVQASVEAALTGASWAAVSPMALGDGGLDLYVEDVPLDPRLIVKLRKLSAEFWRRVAEEDPYPPDWNRDVELVKSLYDPDEVSTKDFAGDAEVAPMLALREAYKARESDGSAAAKERKIIDARLIHKLGNASRGILPDGRVIEVSITKRSGYVVDPTQFPVLKVKDGEGGKSGKRSGGAGTRAQSSARTDSF